MYIKWFVMNSPIGTSCCIGVGVLELEHVSPPNVNTAEGGADKMGGTTTVQGAIGGVLNEDGAILAETLKIRTEGEMTSHFRLFVF
jgi:hypothetical protein